MQPAQRCAQVTADGTERALEASDAEGVVVRVDPIDLGEHGAHAAHGRRCAVPATYPPSFSFAQVGAILRPQLHTGVTLCERLDGCEGHVIDTNPMMLVQILTNLAQNAAKHTNAGFVELRACAAATATPGVVSLEVGPPRAREWRAPPPQRLPSL